MCLAGRFGLVNLDKKSLVVVGPFSPIQPNQRTWWNQMVFKLCNHVCFCSSCVPHVISHLGGAKNIQKPFPSDPSRWFVRDPSSEHLFPHFVHDRGGHYERRSRSSWSPASAQHRPWFWGGTVEREHARDAGEIIIDDYYVWIQVWNMKPFQTYFLLGHWKMSLWFRLKYLTFIRFGKCAIILMSSVQYLKMYTWFNLSR